MEFMATYLLINKDMLSLSLSLSLSLYIYGYTLFW